MVWPYYASFLALTVSNSCLFTPALLRTHLFVFFAVHEVTKQAESFSTLSSQMRQDVSSLCLSVQFSLSYVAAGHGSAFISRVFVEIGMLRLFSDFSIFSAAMAAMPRSPAPVYLLRNSVVHSPSSVIRDQVWERIHLLQLLILNEYAARYAVASHNLGLVDVLGWGQNIGLVLSLVKSPWPRHFGFGRDQNFSIEAEMRPKFWPQHRDRGPCKNTDLDLAT